MIEDSEEGKTTDTGGDLEPTGERESESKVIRPEAPGAPLTKREWLDGFAGELLKDQRPQAMIGTLRERVIATFDADGLTSEGGFPGKVGHFLVALHGYMEAMGAVMFMRELDFAHSVRVVLEPVVPPDASEALEAREEERMKGELTVPEINRLVPASVPAAQAAVHFLAQDEAVSDPLAPVRHYSAAAVDHYVGLARYVLRQEGTLTIASERETGRLEQPRATRIVSASERVRPLEPLPLTIVGKLTRTDSDDQQFRVVLDRERIPPEIDGRKRHIEGPYSDEAREQVEAGGLWNQVVVADVLGHRQRDPTRMKPVLARFEFTGLRRYGG